MGSLATWLRVLLNPFAEHEPASAVGKAVAPPPVTQETWPSPPADAIALFLDFDGVLHRAENGSFERMPQLVTLMQRFPQLHIVLSTNWRLHARRLQLLDYFPDAIHERLIGVTPYLPSSWPPRRERECHAFAHRAGLTRYVALDDDASGYSEGCSFLVLTDRYVGLDDDAVSRVEARLVALGAIAADS
ncbi:MULTISPECIES: HAD domain-containing protein [unclassified Rhodanobacter]|uniref:HAD domain-containing protein n=1 Tax=unclassified Rhodanobacter TaxID=2621553 RepID=UPI0007AA38ED|nr:HAD domain-containing protein [Rhodanobacter sp. FW510-R10]KZC30051.1 hypothetical protein RhoFW510R10_03505 [Rhodanobacter sp. FW510-R10]